MLCGGLWRVVEGCGGLKNEYRNQFTIQIIPKKYMWRVVEGHEGHYILLVKRFYKFWESYGCKKSIKTSTLLFLH
jgi:hypothetical protein